MASTTVERLAVFQAEASQCTSCRTHGLVHVEATHGHARPMLQRAPTARLGILVVGEAPNWDDTFRPEKGYLTYEADTDPTGRFMRTLLIEEAGLAEHEINDVLFSNSVLCLPSKEGGKHRVRRKQFDLCSPWLKRLIDDSGVKAVVTMGASPLRALKIIERHRLTLRSAVGSLHPWYGRQLLPLYHPGALGRIARPPDQQRNDIRPLRELLVR